MSPHSVIDVHTVPRLPPRPADSHKGTFGKVVVIAGSVGMSGAAVLCGTAALRGGAGLVQVAVPRSIVATVAVGCPCFTTYPLAAVDGQFSQSALAQVRALTARADAVVVGPGLGVIDDVGALVEVLITDYLGPLVLDADALNVLDARRRWQLKQRTAAMVLTPHPGEFGRLIDSDTAAVQADRRGLAQTFARDHGGVLVLKGAGTLVTDGARLYTNTTGNPGMATGGSGDVLAGLLGALLAQGQPAFEAATLAVHAHGLAGDRARDEVGEVSLIATDILDHLAGALRTTSGPEREGPVKPGKPG